MSEFFHILFYPIDWIAGFFPWGWMGMLFGGSIVIIVAWGISIPLYMKYIQNKEPSLIRSAINIPVHIAMFYPLAASIYVALSFLKALVQSI